jgi:hypothetical protein
MTQDEIINAWNKQADYMNKWNYLGEDEKLEWAIKLEREACAKVADLVAREIDDTNGTSTYIAAAIRARGEQA